MKWSYQSSSLQTAPSSRSTGEGTQAAQLAASPRMRRLEAQTDQLIQENSARALPAVVQRLAAGDYRTTKSGHLRHVENHEILAKIAAGTVVTSLGQTRRFSLGVFSFAKDHTLVRCEDKSGWMRDEVLEPVLPQTTARGPTRGTSVTATGSDRVLEPSKPIRSTRIVIPGRGKLATLPHESLSASEAIAEEEFKEDDDAAASPDDLGLLATSMRAHPPIRSRYRATPPDEVASSLESISEKGAKYKKVKHVEINQQQQQAFEKLHVYMHFTKTESRDAIHIEGLIPGKGKGIGLPNDEGGRGDSDTTNVYVVSGSPNSNPLTKTFVSSEAGEGDVIVISRHPARDSDTNYKRGNFQNTGAYRFPHQIPPGRGYRPQNTTSGDEPVMSAISLVLPLTESAKTGLVDFINEGTQEAAHVDAAEAEYLLTRKLFQLYPMRFGSYMPRSED